MKLNKFFVVTMLSAFLLSGCSMFSKDVDSIEVSPLPQVENHFTSDVRWSKSVGNGKDDYYSALMPAVQDYFVYAVSRNGVVKAFDLHNGDQIWSTNIAKKRRLFSKEDPMLSAGVSVYADYLFVGSEKGVVYALDSRSGELIWEVDVEGEILSEPVVTGRNGKVVVHTSNGKLIALNTLSGVKEWESAIDVSPLSLRGQSAPVVAKNLLLVGDDNGHLNAYLIDSGQMVWQQKISFPKGSTEIDLINDVDVMPIVNDDIVYAVGYNGNLVAINLNSGELVWKRDIGSIKDFLVHNSNIYLIDKEDGINAIDVSSGNILWRQNLLLNRQLTPPVLQHGIIVVGDSEGYLHWIDTLGGIFVSQMKIDSSGFWSKPIVADDLLIIQAKNGKLYSISRY